MKMSKVTKGYFCVASIPQVHIHIIYTVHCGATFDGQISFSVCGSVFVPNRKHMRINIYICKLAIGPKLNGQAWQERQNGAKESAENGRRMPFNQAICECNGFFFIFLGRKATGRRQATL